MLKASGDTRRRSHILGGALLFILGGATLAGVVQRQRPASPDVDNALSIERYRSASNRLRELSSRRAWKEVVTLADENCAEGEPCNGILRLARFEAWMRLGNVAKAMEDRAALGLDRDPAGVSCALAIEGKQEEFLAHAEALLKKADIERLSATEANNLAWACVLMPGAVSQPETVVALARKGAAGAPREDLPNFLNTLGVALYRTRRDAEAIQTLDRTERLYGNPYNEVFLALVHHRLGHKEKAEGYAKKFREHMDESFGRTEAARHEKVLFLQELNEAMPPPPTSLPKERKSVRTGATAQ